MTLKEAKCGEVVLIKDFILKEDNPLLKKLIAMGIRKDETFEVIKKCGRNILIMNEGNRLVLSKELADIIEVEIIQKKSCSLEEISCELVDKACPKEGHLSQKGNKHRNRKRHRWGLLQKLCPFLKD